MYGYEIKIGSETNKIINNTKYTNINESHVIRIFTVKGENLLQYDFLDWQYYRPSEDIL